MESNTNSAKSANSVAGGGAAQMSEDGSARGVTPGDVAFGNDDGIDHGDEGRSASSIMGEESGGLGVGGGVGGGESVVVVEVGGGGVDGTTARGGGGESAGGSIGGSVGGGSGGCGSGGIISGVVAIMP